MEIRVVEVLPLQLEIPREIDITICYGKPNVSDRHLEDLNSPRIFPVCSPRLLFGHVAIERPEQLTPLPLLHDNQNSWEKWFASMGPDAPVKELQTHIF